MARLGYFLLLALVFRALEMRAQEDGENKNASESIEGVIQDTEETFSLTKEICTGAHRSSYLSSQCCKRFNIYDIDNQIIAFCSSKLPTPDKDKTKQMIQFSIYAECIYKRKKYIKDSKHLNIGHIKADAAKLGDPLKEKYLLDMYRHCGREAQKTFNIMTEMVRSEPEARKTQQSLHKPYFLFVFICVMHYSENKLCPYFRWGSQVLDVNGKCLNYAELCNELMKQ